MFFLSILDHIYQYEELFSGYENDEGKFYVDDCVFYECGPQKPLSTLSTSPLIVLISGLDQSSMHDFSVSLELFQQWLYGNLPNVFGEPDFEASNVIHVIVAGNSVRTTSEVRPKTLLMRQPESISTLEAVKSVDDILYWWSKSVKVDLMPGEFDPSNCMIPQQPMHNCMFPESSANRCFKCVTNPYELEIEDRLILGTAGQNVSNIQKYSNIEDPIEVLKSIVKWSILAPTAPDTLPCYPYINDDPFIIKRCPHILFAGNSSEYGTNLYEGNVFIIPHFDQMVLSDNHKLCINYYFFRFERSKDSIDLCSTFFKKRKRRCS